MKGKDEKSEKEKKEVHRCDQCKGYDHATEREFHRDGIREGLVEIRAICRSPKSKAKNHLVKNDSDRPCFEKGKYVKPKKKTKVETEKVEEEKTAPSEYHGPPLTEEEKEERKNSKVKVIKTKKRRGKVRSATLEHPNGEVKTFEKKGKRMVLAKQ